MIRRPAAVLIAALIVGVGLAATAGPAGAADPSSAGDLSGNLPWQVVLLIPTVLVLGLVTALALSGERDTEPIRQRAGGVTRALEHRAADAGGDAGADPDAGGAAPGAASASGAHPSA
jgi:hypothetical protein